MSSKLFISLSTVALLGLSTVAYGDWIWYSKDNSVSKPEGRLPNGDCLELICTNGCVEDSSNEYLGGCCPSNGTSGKACTVDGKDVSACCQEGLSCVGGQCKAMNCQIGTLTYQDGDAIDACHYCHDGISTQAENGTTKIEQSDGKCCIDGELKYDDTYCPTPPCEHLFQYQGSRKSGQGNDLGCCEGGNLLTKLTNTIAPQGYKKDEDTKYGCCPKERTTVNQTCCKTTEKALSTGCCPTNKIYKDGTEEKCCPVGENLPKYEETCNGICHCYDEINSGLTCNLTSQKCECPKDYGWDNKTQKCLPYCTENMGVFLLVDRSGSTFDDKGKRDLCDKDDEACDRINHFLDRLDLSDRNYAFYHSETEDCGYTQAMSVLPFGQHSASDYNLWKGMNHRFVCDRAPNTRFDNALAHIKSHYCKSGNPIVIMIITDGEIQNHKDDMAASMNYMINRCDARIVYIGPDGSKLKKNMDKNVTNFENYSFKDDIQTWITATNDAINGACIPTNKGKRNFSKSDTSWFCNVLKYKTSTNSYWRLTKDECLFCPSGTTKWREASDSGWKNAGIGICCGENNDSDNCKDKKGREWYRKDEE